MRGIVPDAILQRRDKIGFATPEWKWLKLLDKWVQAVLGSDAAHSVPILNLPVARAEWNEVREGKRPFDFRVWRWLNVIRWTEQFQVAYD